MCRNRVVFWYLWFQRVSRISVNTYQVSQVSEQKHVLKGTSMLRSYKLAAKGAQSDYRVVWRAAGRQALSDSTAQEFTGRDRETQPAEPKFLNFRDLGKASDSLRKGACSKV
jgi:hypothetical protein